MDVFELEHQQSAAGSRPDLGGAKKYQTAKKQINGKVDYIPLINTVGRLFNEIERGTVFK